MLKIQDKKKWIVLVYSVVLIGIVIATGLAEALQQGSITIDFLFAAAFLAFCYGTASMVWNGKGWKPLLQILWFLQIFQLRFQDADYSLQMPGLHLMIAINRPDFFIKSFDIVPIIVFALITQMEAQEKTTQSA